MNLKEFKQLINKQIALENSILDTKGKDYTRGEGDRLANFKRVARTTNVDKLRIWQVYFEKQYDAIVSYIAGNKESEPIELRIADARNYLLLLLGLIKEDESAKKSREQ